MTSTAWTSRPSCNSSAIDIRFGGGGIRALCRADDVRVKPFDQQRCSPAIKYALDRQQVVNKVLLGHGSPGHDNPIAKGVPFAVEPKNKHAFDPEKAKFHLKKAGMSDLKIDLSTSDAAFAGAVDAAQLMADLARQSGISMMSCASPPMPIGTMSG